MTQPRAFSKVRSLACLALLLLFVSGSGAQQGTSGSIEGTITDQQGGAIANAKLTAVNAATGLTLQASSDDNGLFHFRSEEHTSELQSQSNLVCRLLLEKKK